MAPEPRLLAEALAQLPSTDCVIWTGSLVARGYGFLKIENRNVGATAPSTNCWSARSRRGW